MYKGCLSAPCLSNHQNISFKFSLVKIACIIIHCASKTISFALFCNRFLFSWLKFLCDLYQKLLVLSLKFDDINTSDRCPLMQFFQFLIAFLFLAKSIFQSFDLFLLKFIEFFKIWMIKWKKENSIWKIKSLIVYLREYTFHFGLFLHFSR